MTEIIEEISKLSKAEQAYIAHYILDALANDNTLTTQQLAIIKQRAASIKNKDVVTYSWQDMQNEINKEHGFDIALPQ